MAGLLALGSRKQAQTGEAVLYLSILIENEELLAKAKSPANIFVQGFISPKSSYRPVAAN